MCHQDIDFTNYLSQETEKKTLMGRCLERNFFGAFPVNVNFSYNLFTLKKSLFIRIEM